MHTKPVGKFAFLTGLVCKNLDRVHKFRLPLTCISPAAYSSSGSLPSILLDCFLRPIGFPGWNRSCICNKPNLQ
ncbi:hypothetical protein HMPREF9374_1878 [Desmospora sp. 8437]|nr:hypothetical protein HMPREF9374_1878 [Desmospora sp. 8437]